MTLETSSVPRLSRNDAIVAAVALVYWSACLLVGFFLDDIHNLERALAAPLTLEGLKDGFSVFDPSTVGVWCLEREAVTFFRPLFVLSLKLDHAIWGLAPFGYHLTNLTLHTVNALMAHRLLLRVGVSGRTSLLGACLFAAFPHHTVAVHWLSGRTELLLATFVLASVLTHVKALGGERVVLWRVLSFLFAAAAFLTKEGAVVLPGFLVLSEWMARGHSAGWGRTAARVARSVAPVIALTALYLYWRLGVMGLGATPPKPYFVPPTDPVFPAYLGVKTLYYYFAWLTSLPILPIWPVAILFAHPPVLVVVALLTLAGWGGIIWLLRKDRRTWGWLLWTAAGLVPTVSVMASNHYTYLSNVGVAVIGAAALLRIPAPWLRRALVGVTAFWFALHAGWGAISYYGFAEKNERMVDAVLEVAPEVSEGDVDLYFVNLPFLAAHVGQRVRVLRGVDDVRPHMVTVSSEPFAPGPAPTARWSGPDALTLELPEGWFSNELVKMFLMMGVDVQPGQAYASGTAQLVPRAGAGAGGGGELSSLELRWPEDDRRRVVIMLRPGAEPGDPSQIVRLAPDGERAVSLSL